MRPRGPRAARDKRRGDRTTQRACVRPWTPRRAPGAPRRRTAAVSAPLRALVTRRRGVAAHDAARRVPTTHPLGGARPRPRTRNLTLFRSRQRRSLAHALRARPQNLKRLLVIGEMQVLAKLRREHKWNDEEEVVREEIAHAASRDASAAAARDAEENAFLAMDAPNARSGR
jgi:hypothetical protein